MKYLFYLLNEYSIPVIKPMVEYLNHNHKNDLYKFSVAPKLENKVKKIWGANNCLSTLNEIKDYSPNFVISAENYIDFRIPGIKVQIFHGVGVEKKSHFIIRHFYDVYLTSGPYVTKRFNKLAEQYSYFKVIETGWPKFDHILNYSTTPLQISKQNKKKYILYAPTFSRRMQSAYVLANTIIKEKKEDEIWLIKFHELMSPNLIELFKEAENETLKIIYDSDITPYLHLADVMVSDTSSVVYEFLSLDKPVITFKSIGNLSKGINIKKAEDLRKTLDLVLQNPDINREERTKMLLQVNPYLDGKVSKRVFDALVKINKSGLQTKKEKPLNLFRKAKILYKNN